MDDIEVTLQEQMFHNAVREYIISLLLFILLYVISYVTLCQFRKTADSEDMYSGEEDADVYRISLWLCTSTLSLSVGAVLLLPISIISNEVLHLYPDSYYIKFLNSSLIQGLWNYVFFLSNLALFIFMPFAYFFMEAAGFSGSRHGVMSRVYETSLVLALLAVAVLGLAFVASAMMGNDESSRQTLFDVWHEHLPYLYSVISFFGVLVLLMCTPVGVARMFTVMGQLIVKPQFYRDLDERLSTLTFEEANLKTKIMRYHVPIPSAFASNGHHTNLSNGHHTNLVTLEDSLSKISEEKKTLEQRKHLSFWRKNLCYPIAMLLLLILTVVSILIVIQNTVLVLVGTKALTKGASDTFLLGYSSLSSFGVVGAAFQIVIILYLMVASVVGFYSLPYLRELRPRRADTPMVKIIGNCLVILLLSSALPILSKTLGITNFDLVGNFGSMDWLGNIYIILLYNVVFVVCTALCLFTKFTATVRREIYQRLRAAFRSERSGTTTTSAASSNGGGRLGARLSSEGHGSNNNLAPQSSSSSSSPSSQSSSSCTLSSSILSPTSSSSSSSSSSLSNQNHCEQRTGARVVHSSGSDNSVVVDGGGGGSNGSSTTSIGCNGNGVSTNGRGSVGVGVACNGGVNGSHSSIGLKQD